MVVRPRAKQRSAEKLPNGTTTLSKVPHSVTTVCVGALALKKGKKPCQSRAFPTRVQISDTALFVWLSNVVLS